MSHLPEHKPVLQHVDPPDLYAAREAAQPHSADTGVYAVYADSFAVDLNCPALAHELAKADPHWKAC